MAYRLKKNESVPVGIKRVVLEEIDSATEQLGNTTARDEAIHEARKSLKKVRGVVRLVQPELGRSYARENSQLGAIGRQLSELRDAKAIIEVFDSLLEKYKDHLRNDALSSLRCGLEKSKQETEQAVDPDKTVKQAIATLRSVRKRVNDWPLAADNFEALAPGLRQRYRRGRKAMAAARKSQTPEAFHEWRKRVKDHWYHIRLLEGAWTEILHAREASLKTLETWLGDDHNLVVLSAKIQENPDSFGEPADVHLFLALSTQYQKELRADALSLGERLYQEKSKPFTQNLSKLWEAWQAEAKRKPAKSEPARAARSSAA